MLLREDWMHVRKKEKPTTVILTGEVADPESEVWIVKQMGPSVTTCKLNDEIIVGGLGSGVRWKYNEAMYHAVRELDVICVMNRSK